MQDLILLQNKGYKEHQKFEEYRRQTHSNISFELFQNEEKFDDFHSKCVGTIIEKDPNFKLYPHIERFGKMYLYRRLSAFETALLRKPDPLRDKYEEYIKKTELNIEYETFMSPRLIRDIHTKYIGHVIKKIDKRYKDIPHIVHFGCMFFFQYLDTKTIFPQVTEFVGDVCPV